MSRPEASSRVAGAVTTPTIATFVSIWPRAFAIDTIGIVALGSGSAHGKRTASGLRSTRASRLAVGAGSATLTTSAGSRSQSR